MHSLAIPVNRLGALADIRIGLPIAMVNLLRQQGRPLPAPQLAPALIDPGAEISCVDTQLLAPLIASGLQPQRFVLTNVPATGGMGMAIVYRVGITILHPSGKERDHFVLRSLAVLDQPLSQLGYQALLGRDVLADCLFIYDGPLRRVTLAY
jgi:hypothetical protein